MLGNRVHDEPGSGASSSGVLEALTAKAVAWLDRIDPGAHRRIKGLRLVTAYGIAAMVGALLGSSSGVAGGALLGPLAAGFALWGSVSEGQSTRALSSRDL